MNLLISTQHPERFLTEDHFKLTMHSDTISTDQIKDYKKAGIEYLILTYRSNHDFGADYMQELKNFNNWTIYKLL